MASIRVSSFEKRLLANGFKMLHVSNTREQFVENAVSCNISFQRKCKYKTKLISVQWSFVSF